MKEFLPALLLCCAGCASSYPYYFTPSPAEVRIEPEGGAPVARTLITVLEGEQGNPPRMLIRIRVENLADDPVRLDPDSLQLVSSSLVEFGAPSIVPEDTEVPPHDHRTFDLRFGFPRELSLYEPVLDGLHLNWRIGYAGGSADVSTTFRRSEAPATQFPVHHITWSLNYGF